MKKPEDRCYRRYRDQTKVDESRWSLDAVSWLGARTESCMSTPIKGYAHTVHGPVQYICMPVCTIITCTLYLWQCIHIIHSNVYGVRYMYASMYDTCMITRTIYLWQCVRIIYSSVYGVCQCVRYMYASVYVACKPVSTLHVCQCVRNMYASWNETSMPVCTLHLRKCVRYMYASWSDTIMPVCTLHVCQCVLLHVCQLELYDVPCPAACFSLVGGKLKGGILNTPCRRLIAASANRSRRNAASA